MCVCVCVKERERETGCEREQNICSFNQALLFAKYNDLILCVNSHFYLFDYYRFKPKVLLFRIYDIFALFMIIHKYWPCLGLKFVNMEYFFVGFGLSQMTSFYSTRVFFSWIL